MWIFVFFGILIVAAMLHIRFRSDPAEALSMAYCGTLLLLYALAFINRLNWINFLGTGIFAGAFLSLRARRRRMSASAGEKKNSGKPAYAYGQEMDQAEEQVFARFRGFFLDVRVLTTLVFILLLTLLVKDQIYTWWDDLNFWASDAKSIFFLGGFAGKYGNVSPEFGDYPPMTSLSKWLFLNISPSNYREGLAFAGYYASILMLLLPLTTQLREKKIWQQILGTVVIFMIPGVVNGVLFYGTCADVIMGLLYGNLLLTLWRYTKEEQGPANEEADQPAGVFRMLQIIITSALLPLSKSTGMMWVVFALLFYLLVCRKNIQRRKTVFFTILLSSLFTEGTWLLFCVVHRRISKVVGLGVNMMFRGYRLPSNTWEKIVYFWKGFWLYPMHSHRNITLDLSTGVFFVLCIVAWILLLCRSKVQSGEGRRLLLFTVLSGLIAYGIVFFSHISIFQTEDQYLDASAMGISMARYAVPFTLGQLMLLGEMFLSEKKNHQEQRRMPLGMYVFFAFVLLTADYTGMWSGTVGYRQSLSENLGYRQDMIDADGKTFLETYGDSQNLWGKRVLYLRDGNAIHWVKDTYISNEASPIAMVYGSYIAETTEDQIMEMIRTSHAAYVYADPLEGGALLENVLTPGQIYSVENGELGTKLVPVE